jgi:thiol:disulfide interchange protein DsbD
VLKQAAALVFFATAIWLAWVYGQLFPIGDGVNEIALLLGGFLLLAVAGWVLGRWPAKLPGLVIAVALIALAIDIPISQRKNAHKVSAATGTSAATAQTDSGPLTWQPYSEQAIEKARTTGHPVFIDFTASWCLSCQFNERTVLDSSEVQSALRNRNFTLLKADWTNDDPEITKKLASIGRAGVPTYVIYPATASGAADVLPELLSKDIVLRAIARNTK